MPSSIVDTDTYSGTTNASGDIDYDVTIDGSGSNRIVMFAVGYRHTGTKASESFLLNGVAATGIWQEGSYDPASAINYYFPYWNATDEPGAGTYTGNDGLRVNINSAARVTNAIKVEFQDVDQTTPFENFIAGTEDSSLQNDDVLSVTIPNGSGDLGVAVAMAISGSVFTGSFTNGGGIDGGEVNVMGSSGATRIYTSLATDAVLASDSEVLTKQWVYGSGANPEAATILGFSVKGFAAPPPSESSANNTALGGPVGSSISTNIFRSITQGEIDHG